MKTISIDLETYSSVDLAKAGVYRYVESDDFEILLFGYAIDGGDVEVIDVACGERIPPEIINALTDNTIKKFAYNAQFERVCLSKILGYPSGKYINPESWYCTLVWAATLGLPLSLEKVGEVLGLEKQKLTVGKELIRYFCKPCEPSIANGQRERNLPRHDPKKWEAFKAYNKRDVETEMAIQKRLSVFPVPDREWDNYHLDQRINDYGIALDMDFVEHAIHCDEVNTGISTEKAKALTGVDNPNSPAQLKAWLIEQGQIVESLSKAEVNRLLQDATGNIEEILRLRQELAKSSVKKYIAMKSAVCADGRARGLLQFYGANRTGRFCLTGDHEVLTDKGWERLDKWQGGRIACWTPNGEIISFQKANALSFSYQGAMYEYEDKRIAQISTPDHKMYVKKRYDRTWETDTVENMAAYRPSIPFTGYRTSQSGMEHFNLRVLVMVQADGHYCEDGTIMLGFSKTRKVERCKMLLRQANIAFTCKNYTENNKTRYQFKIASRNVPLWLRLFREKTFDSWLFDESADVFFDELEYWDGYRSAKNSIQYSTCNKQNADMVQAFAHISGRAAQVKEKNRSDENPNWHTAYVVDIWLTPKNCHEIKNKPTISQFVGTVYCAETSTGYFLVRRKGRVWVTGNSGRLIQVQNLPQNHLEDLKGARDLVCSDNYEEIGDKYGNIPNVLSELIRTAFVAKDGHRFIVADFSAIEARVIAWYAGEDWRLDVFKNGGDIYCASASQMFKVKVVKNGENGHLRQKGKIAELALGYGGSVGALKAMGATAMGIPEEELKPLVTAWRNSNPHITKFWWAIDKAVMYVVKTKQPYSCYGLKFSVEKGILFIELPSGRRLAYVRPRIGVNNFGSDCVTYEGLGSQKKWERIESYGPKFVENIVQATARDILVEAMQRLDKLGYKATMHIHDEVVLEVPDGVSSVEEVCDVMSIAPDWASTLCLRADGYECTFYKKE